VGNIKKLAKNHHLFKDETSLDEYNEYVKNNKDK
tara:strand:- start:37 stop:138 length:102 start_codon:yes stop_codon:yes gene_type:complete